MKPFTRMALIILFNRLSTQNRAKEMEGRP
jgi:hypothetical protein